MYNFLNSTLLQTIIIFVVGLFAFLIYKFQKRYDRKIAATILIMEIREIEEALNKLREVVPIKNYYSSPPIIKGNSWEKYKFFFIKYLDADEYNLISEFYSTASRIEEERLILIEQIIISFKTKCKAFHESIVDIAKEKYGVNDDEFLDITKKIVQKVCLNTPGYLSDTPEKLMNLLLQNIKYITTSTAGLKIKRIAHII